MLAAGISNLLVYLQSTSGSVTPLLSSGLILTTAPRRGIRIHSAIVPLGVTSVRQG